jgi:flagellar hook-length control protein FliK
MPESLIPELQSATTVPPGVKAQPHDSAQLVQRKGKFSSVLADEQAALDDASGQDLQKSGSHPQAQETAAVREFSKQTLETGNDLPYPGNFDPVKLAALPSAVIESVGEMPAGASDTGRMGLVSVKLGESLAAHTTTGRSNSDLTTVPATKLARPMPNVAFTAGYGSGLASGDTIGSSQSTVQEAIHREFAAAKQSEMRTNSANLLAAALPTAQFAAVQTLSDAQAPAAISMQTTPFLTAVSSGTNSAVTGTTMPSMTLDMHFQQTGWDRAVGDRVVWMVNQRLQGAEIRLNPPELGPIEVRINMQGDQAQISFSAQHASVREALEAAIPRLRDMFGHAGLDLGDVNVSRHPSGQPNAGDGGRHDPAGFATAHLKEHDEGITSEAPIGLRPRGVIDLFA